MKILAILDTFRPPGYMGNVGGGEISNRILLKGLSRGGHSIRVVTRHGCGAWRADDLGMQVYDISAVCPVQVLRKPFALALYRLMAFRVAKAFTPDVIVSATSSIAIAAAVGRRLNTPVGAFVRAFENFDNFDAKPSNFRNLIRDLTRSAALGNSRGRAVKQVGFLLPNSQFIADKCRREFMFPRIHLVYPPLDLSIQPFQRKRSIQNICMVGTSPRKGSCVVKQLARRMPHLEFLIIGDPSLSPGQSVSKDNLTITGWLNERTSFLTHADIVLVPSLWEEPFGRVVLEALAAGKLVLVSNTGGLPETLARQELLMVPPGNIDAWQSRLEHAVECPDIYFKACQAARTRLAQFSEESQIKALERALIAEAHHGAK